MVRLQKGRQAFTGILDVPFDNCQEKFIHQFWNLFPQRLRGSQNETVDISKYAYGKGIPISEQKCLKTIMKKFWNKSSNT